MENGEKHKLYEGEHMGDHGGPLTHFGGLTGLVEQINHGLTGLASVAV